MMKVFECEYYEVTCPDGGGMRTETVASFTTATAAFEVAAILTKEKNWPHTGSAHPKRIVKSVFESVQEYKDSVDKEIIREKALAKLSDIERKVLGL